MPAEYTAILKCSTKAGGVSRPATLNITVEADSREEALVRMRSAAARVLSKPGTKEVGDTLTTRDSTGYISSEAIIGEHSTIGQVKADLGIQPGIASSVAMMRLEGEPTKLFTSTKQTFFASQPTHEENGN
jgi:hypothetical protein